MEVFNKKSDMFSLSGHVFQHCMFLDVVWTHSSYLSLFLFCVMRYHSMLQRFLVYCVWLKNSYSPPPSVPWSTITLSLLARSLAVKSEPGAKYSPTQWAVRDRDRWDSRPLQRQYAIGPWTWEILPTVWPIRLLFWKEKLLLGSFYGLFKTNLEPQNQEDR